MGKLNNSRGTAPPPKKKAPAKGKAPKKAKATKED